MRDLTPSRVLLIYMVIAMAMPVVTFSLIHLLNWIEKLIHWEVLVNAI